MEGMGGLCYGAEMYKVICLCRLNEFLQASFALAADRLIGFSSFLFT